ncbi:TetR/AcrR family transcriptional regulator [Leucobacter luti]|uniref:TetR family transcriptional regulator n=1 Tax=Leucobacter luti TaxID=340320 RepID=A0A4R6S659_9MICO|nr:TetR/AcrR family transcriptional regulator [Leucobacter luti]MCW2286985.1 AcrR family transcriptional regulator [Leucobacter luti]TCK41211.1 TetR family transcriptional regulator [Leucobacter luti]TDP94266.1 TetR family transcriptional regulator [Leucobacter luti]
MSAQIGNGPAATHGGGGAQRRDAAQNRSALLRAAQATLADYPNASLDTVAQAAGLSRRALYGHFPDRDALLREVIAVGASQFSAISEATVDDDPRVSLAHLAARLWREATAVRASANIAADDAYQAETAQALEPLRRRLTELTQTGVGSGAFRADMTPELLAFLIEETARATLRERRVIGATTVATAVNVVLSIAGLSWREQEALLAAHPEIFDGE